MAIRIRGDKLVIELKTYALYWSPEGRQIATVQANTAQGAIRKAPRPYSKYPGEIYAVEQK